MKTHFKLFATFALAIGVNYSAFCQFWQTTGNPVTAGQYLGSQNNQPLDIKTDNTHRLRIMPSGTTTVNNYLIDHDGFVGMSTNPNFFNLVEPFSLLHLNGQGNGSAGPQQFGYRPWMREGIVFTQNSDLMYIGPMANAQDVTDAVITWSDNWGQGEVGPDVLRFLFTSNGNGTTVISPDPMNPNDFDGVETARIMGDARMGIGPMWTNNLTPKRALDVIRRNDDLPQFRITYSPHTTSSGGAFSDFQVSSGGNLHIKPKKNGGNRTVAIGFLQGEISDPINSGLISTALDVGGITRIRKLYNDSVPDCIVVGYNPGSNPLDNFLMRIDMPKDTCLVLNGLGGWTDICNLGGGGGNDFDWQTDGHDVWTGHGTEGYPDGDVFIGISPPILNAKFNIVDIKGGTDPTAQLIRFSAQSGITGKVQGIDAWVGNTFGPSIGIDMVVDGKKQSHGARFRAVTFGQSETSVGVIGIAQSNTLIYSDHNQLIGVYGTASSTYPGSKPIGIYGEAAINGDYTVGIAGHFAGPIQTSAGVITLSDETTKTDIETLEGATETLNALIPRTYHYDWEEVMGYAGTQDLVHGFVAQEVQDVYPQAVASFHQPARFDTSGVLIHESADLLGLRYNAFIPLLVAGFKEQQGVISEQAATIAEQNAIIENLQGQMNQQAQEISELQVQMAQFAASFQQAKSDMNNCCGLKNHATGHVPATDKGVTLEQNRPNPFANQTTISFALPEDATVRLEISDASGRVLEVLLQTRLDAGTHQIDWDASHLPAGVYYYSLYADTVLLTKKMIKR